MLGNKGLRPQEDAMRESTWKGTQPWLVEAWVMKGFLEEVTAMLSPGKCVTIGWRRGIQRTASAKVLRHTCCRMDIVAHSFLNTLAWTKDCMLVLINTLEIVR